MVAMQLSCGHAFCSQCIRNHLDHCSSRSEEGSCPECRERACHGDIRHAGALRELARVYREAVRVPLLRQLQAHKRAPQAKTTRPQRAAPRAERLEYSTAIGGATISAVAVGDKPGKPKCCHARAQRMSSLWYKAFSESKLKARLKEDGVAVADGEGRAELEARHKAWMSRYNGLVDAEEGMAPEERRPEAALRADAARQVAREERVRKAAAFAKSTAAKEWWSVVNPQGGGAAGLAIAGTGVDGSFDAQRAAVQARMDSSRREAAKRALDANARPQAPLLKAPRLSNGVALVAAQQPTAEQRERIERNRQEAMRRAAAKRQRDAAAAAAATAMGPQFPQPQCAPPPQQAVARRISGASASSVASGCAGAGGSVSAGSCQQVPHSQPHAQPHFASMATSNEPPCAHLYAPPHEVSQAAAATLDDDARLLEACDAAEAAYHRRKSGSNGSQPGTAVPSGSEREEIVID